jgi:hypothetical protein
LAVFTGGCTLEAAETVCGGEGIDLDTVFELLASLVARSLVVAEEHGPESRYRLSISDAGRLRAQRGVDHVPVAAWGQRGPGATRRDRAPGLPLALAAVSAVSASGGSDRAGAAELSRRALEANARRDAPDWRVEESVCTARSNIAFTAGAFADASSLAERAAGLARAGGDLADASLELAIAGSCYLVAGETPTGVRLANEALRLARQVGAPALIATALLAVGVTVAQTEPERARACLRESRELSTMLGYQRALDHVWAAVIASLLGDRTATLELGGRAIRTFGWSGDRLRMGVILHLIAGALADTQPDDAAIIQGAAEAYVLQSPMVALAGSSIDAGTLGDSRALELRARGADMDWDDALSYTLTQTSQALKHPQPTTQR